MPTTPTAGTSYVVAGFFVTTTVARDAARSPDLLPTRLVSLSPCIAPSYQVYWGWDVERSREDATKFGLRPEDLPRLLAWEQAHGISHPNVFHSLADARAFVAEFLPGRSDVEVLGAGLPAGKVDAFLARDARNGRTSEHGVRLLVSERRALPEGGTRLGVDLVLFDPHLACSWLCTNAEHGVAAALGIRPNRHGLVETDEDALRADAWLAAHPEHLEPGPYYPWVVVRYPLRAE